MHKHQVVLLQGSHGGFQFTRHIGIHQGGKPRLGIRREIEQLSETEDGAFRSHYGYIHVQVPEGAGLDVSMDLFNGRMVSEFPVDPMALPARVDHQVSNGRHQYRIEQPAGVRIAGGGPVFTISSMNGDIKIQKTQ